MAYSYKAPYKKKVNDMGLPDKINELIFRLIDCENYNMKKDKICKQLDAKIDSDMGDGRACIKSSHSDRKNTQERTLYERELFTWIGKFSEISDTVFFDKLNRVERSLGKKKDELLPYVYAYCKIFHKRKIYEDSNKKEEEDQKEKEDEEDEKDKKPFIPPRPINPRHY